MAADGSIVVEAKIDDKQAQQELNRLEKKIDTINEKIYTKEQQKMPLVKQAQELGAALDEAKAKLVFVNEKVVQKSTKKLSRANTNIKIKMRQEQDK